MILVIDNYDSFAHNLARYMARSGWDFDVVRNDAITVADIAALNPQGIVLSPGPGAPKDAGICLEVIKAFGATTPVLGVCLGHQCIGEAYGGRTVRSPEPMHGKASRIAHKGTGLFADLPSPMNVGRYHSLVVEIDEGRDLVITAREQRHRIAMAVQHKTHPVYGVQFHPESVLTEHGMSIIKNFTQLAYAWNEKDKKTSWA